MTSEIRLHRTLYEKILCDLQRSHPFALERVGFAFGKIEGTGEAHSLILLHRYQSIADQYYVEDMTVGARISQDAISTAMQDVYNGRDHRDGIFHVHIHDHEGEPQMSVTDERELPPMIQGFRSVAKNNAHGILILSSDHGSAWVSLPDVKEPKRCTRIVVTGAPLQIFERGKTW